MFLRKSLRLNNTLYCYILKTNPIFMCNNCNIRTNNTKCNLDICKIMNICVRNNCLKPW